MNTEEFFKSDSNWFVWRETSLSVWGEYLPVSSWKGYRQLNDVLKYEIEIVDANEKLVKDLKDAKD